MDGQGREPAKTDRGAPSDALPAAEFQGPCPQGPPGPHPLLCRVPSAPSVCTRCIHPPPDPQAPGDRHKASPTQQTLQLCAPAWRHNAPRQSLTLCSEARTPAGPLPWQGPPRSPQPSPSTHGGCSASAGPGKKLEKETHESSIRQDRPHPGQRSNAPHTR